jgi:biopolymer transport protein ExbD
MGMNVGDGGRHRAEINVTPMIDVLLVLIIIFMVITLTKQKGLQALVPQQSETAEPHNAPTRDLVVSVAKGSVITINSEVIEYAALADRLMALHRTLYGAHFFVRGERDLAFEDVAKVIDMARGAGWNEIGLMTR